MANATTYLATPTFGIGVNLAGIKDLTDQCKSVVITNRVNHSTAHRSATQAANT